MARSIENIFTSLSSINDSLTKVIDQAKKMSADSSVFDGEISRVLGEQLNNYFIPTITKLRDDENTPGSMIGLSQFLDSIPLAMARQGFSSSEYNLPDVDAAEASSGIETPEGSAPITQEDMPVPGGETEVPSAVTNEVDELPRGISYANPEGEENKEPVLTEAVKAVDCIKDAKNWDEFDDCIMSKSDDWFDKFCRAVDKYAKAGVDASNVDDETETFYKEIGLNAAKAIAVEIDKRSNEKKITEAYNKYRVIRTSTVGTSLDEEVAKVEPTVVAEYDTEEEAKAVADKLNSTVDAEEKDLLGTQYDVDCREYNSEKKEA